MVVASDLFIDTDSDPITSLVLF